MNDIRKVLSFNDVLLSPRNSELEHLSDADIMVHGCLPFINAPMNRVCSVELIKYLDSISGITTIHRFFSSAEEQIRFFEDCGRSDFSFLAVGTLAKWKSWIDRIIQYRREIDIPFGILVDVAQGDSRTSIETVEYIKKETKSFCRIMAGNVATKSGFSRLQDAGADFIRVGIGGSSVCSTRTSCGFGLPTLTSVMDCANVKNSAILIADGGIESSGDIVKALAAGADMVMLGKMLAATLLSGGEKISDNGKIKYVKYSGMASKEAIEQLKGKEGIKSVEGISGLIPYTGETSEVVEGIIGNLKSAMAYYAGCRNWNEFRRKVKFVEISSQGWEESKTRLI